MSVKSIYRSRRDPSYISLCQLNLLAPLWVGEAYKILPCYDKFVDPKRLDTTLDYLLELDTSIYCLCEVEKRQLGKIDKAFSEYHRIYTANAKDFWSEWSEEQWISNGTCVLLDASMYDIQSSSYIDLGVASKKNLKGDGCKCTVVHAIHKATGHSILLAVVHFDTEVRKFIEAITLLSALKKLQKETTFDITLISGDYNFSDVSSFENVGYREVVTDVKDTTPLPQGMIDHTLLLTGHKDIEYRGEVLNIGSGDKSTKSIVEGICATVSTNGSDHYATVSSIRF